MGCLGITKWDFNSELIPGTEAKPFQGFAREKSYQETSGKFAKEMRLYAEYCDRLLQIGSGVTGVGMALSSHEGFSTANSLTTSTRATLSAFRSVLTVEQLVSGDFIERRAVTVKKPAQTPSATEESITQPKTDWLGTASNVFFAIGRFFNTAVWFDRAKAFSLGKHAKWVGGVVSGAFTVGISIFTLQQGRDFVEGFQMLRKIDKETDRTEYEKQLWALKQKSCWVLCGLSDMADMPAGMFAPPPVAAITSIVAGSTWLIGQYLIAG